MARRANPTPKPPDAMIGSHRGAFAFTLVELMAVIAILSVLLAILLPALGRARELARRAVCANNQHQMALGTLTYATDHRGRFPITTRELGTEHASWIHSTLYEQWRRRDVSDASMVCPNRTDLFALDVQRLIDELPDDHPQKDTWQSVVDNQGQDIGVRLGYYVLFGRTDTPWGEPPLNAWVSAQRLSDQHPNLAPLIVDVIEQGTHSFNQLTTAPHGATGLVGPGQDPEAIGSQGGNVTMLDGSVTWRPQADMLPHASTGNGPYPIGQSGYW